MEEKEMEEDEGKREGGGRTENEDVFLMHSLCFIVA